MKKLIKLLKRKIVSVAISAAAVIMVLQNVLLPGWLDWLTDMIILGLIWIVSNFGDHNDA